MKRDLAEFAQKIAQNARAGVVIEKEKLRKILEERPKKVAGVSSATTQENQTNS